MLLGERSKFLCIAYEALQNLSSIYMLACQLSSVPISFTAGSAPPPAGLCTCRLDGSSVLLLLVKSYSFFQCQTTVSLLPPTSSVSGASPPLPLPLAPSSTTAVALQLFSHVSSNSTCASWMRPCLLVSVFPMPNRVSLQICLQGEICFYLYSAGLKVIFLEDLSIW